MDALILAAGRGTRMKPLTDHTPKPLLRVGGQRLIEYHLQGLVAAGLTHLVINHAHLGDQVVQVLGDGRDYGARIHYSDESPGALETGGGIVKALELMDSDPFVVVNGDIWTEFPFADLPDAISGAAHLVLVDNPEHNPDGDFVLEGDRVRNSGAGGRLTFSGIGVYRRDLFAGQRPVAFPLTPLLRQAADENRITGEHYTGNWFDVGTPERLETLDRWLADQQQSIP